MYIPVRKVSFDDKVSTLIEVLIIEARKLARDCIYEANGQVRAAIRAGTADTRGRGVFLLLATKVSGASVVRPYLAESCESPIDLTTSTLPEAIDALRSWHREIAPDPHDTNDE